MVNVFLPDHDEMMTKEGLNDYKQRKQLFYIFNDDETD